MMTGLAGACLGAGASLVVGMALFFGVLAPQTARAEQTVRTALADRDALRKELSDTSSAHRTKLDALGASLAQEKAERARVQAELDAQARSSRRTTTSSSSLAPHATTTQAALGKPCRPLDPLCDTIGK
jgi:hypothetical protein